MHRYHTLPTALLQTIEKYVHELRLADVMAEMKSKRATTMFGEGVLYDFTAMLQIKADEHKLSIVQMGGITIGQEVNMMEDPDDDGFESDEIGFAWQPCASDDWLTEWRNNPHSLKEFHHYTDNDWCKKYATKTTRSGLGANRITVCLMIGSIPDTPEFAAFKELEDDVFMMRYPGFIPVEITIDPYFVTQKKQRRRRNAN